MSDETTNLNINANLNVRGDDEIKRLVGQIDALKAKLRAVSGSKLRTDTFKPALAKALGKEAVALDGMTRRVNEVRNAYSSHLAEQLAGTDKLSRSRPCRSTWRG